jgi:hypothetical protein
MERERESFKSEMNKTWVRKTFFSSVLNASRFPGPNPAAVSYNASILKIYNATTPRVA